MSRERPSKPPVSGLIYGLSELDQATFVPIKVNAFGELITGASTTGGSAAATSISDEYYVATATTADYSSGDTLRLREVIDSNGEATSSVWTNLNTGDSIDAPPSSDIVYKAANALTDDELRAAEVAVYDQTNETKLEELRVILASIFSDTSAIEALNTSQESLLNTLNSYNDGVEGLLSTLDGNTDSLEALLTQLGANTDQIETKQDATIAAIGVTNSGGYNWDFSFTADLDGNITSQTRTRTDSGGTTITETRTFGWDADGNIQSISAWA